MSEETPTPATPQVTKVTIVSSSFELEADLGFPPYMAYMKSLGGKAPAFGTRDMTKATFRVFMSAEVADGDDPDVIAKDLAVRSTAIARQTLRETYGKVAKTAEEQKIPEEAFTISKTDVTKEEVDY